MERFLTEFLGKPQRLFLNDTAKECEVKIENIKNRKTYRDNLFMK